MDKDLEKEICIEFGGSLMEGYTSEEIEQLYNQWIETNIDEHNPMDFGLFLTNEEIEEIGPKYNEFLEENYPQLYDQGDSESDYTWEEEDYERKQNERDTFNFLTDGMGRDYDEFKRRGGDFSQLKDELGID